MSVVEGESDVSEESEEDVVESPAVAMPVELEVPTDVSVAELPVAPMVAAVASAPEAAVAVESAPEAAVALLAASTAEGVTAPVVVVVAAPAVEEAVVAAVVPAVLVA